MKSKQLKNLNIQILDISTPELMDIVKRATLTEEEQQKLTAAITTLGVMMEALKSKDLSIKRLQQMLFGAATEKTSKFLSKKGQKELNLEANVKEKRAGHGRRASAAYTGAEIKAVEHSSLHSGECCPECQSGKVYPLSEPAKLVRITGMAPLGATIWECARLRCNLCGEVYTAETPEDIGNEKYDETATSMVGLLKYGCGLPFYRIEKLQEGFGIPLPATTQWELVREGANELDCVYERLIVEAAQGKVIHNDDTTAKILGLTPEQREAASKDNVDEDRKGVFTTGIASRCGNRTIALFFTGHNHAGENLAEVLAKRAEELSAPVQMCDGLAANIIGEYERFLAGCNIHARRQFVQVFNDFPDECKYVLGVFRDIYKHDAETRRQQLSDGERLTYHQTHSAPLLDELKEWSKRQFDEHLVEPNSGLGAAIKYLNNHWSKLTLFTRHPGVPLDNNLCERVLKKAILHRKNSLFFKTSNGAKVGDVFMSIIHTCELNKVNPFDYLVAVLKNSAEAARSPAEWMPWNYQETVAQLDGSG